MNGTNHYQPDDHRSLFRQAPDSAAPDRQADASAQASPGLAAGSRRLSSSAEDDREAERLKHRTLVKTTPAQPVRVRSEIDPLWLEIFSKLDARNRGNIAA